MLSVHNELLCYIANKSNTVPFEVLVKSCTEFYDSEKIHTAKELLWETTITPKFPGRSDLRLIKRKNGANSKARADMEDILKALQVCDMEGINLPSFYAVDLGCIPPASPAQLDMGLLLGQIHAMQQELCQLKEAVQDMATKPQPAPQTWAQVAQQVSTAGAANPAPAIIQTNNNSQSGSHQLGTSQSGSRPDSSPVMAPASQPHSSGNAQVAHRPPSPQPQQSSRPQLVAAGNGQGFVTAYKTTKNGRKRREVKGTGSSSQLKGVAAPPRVVQLFVGRLDTDTMCEAVVLHVDSIIGEKGKSTATEIPHCAAKYGHKGFKVTIPADTLNAVMQADQWPAHVSVKRYYEPKVSQTVLQLMFCRKCNMYEACRQRNMQLPGGPIKTRRVCRPITLQS